MNRIESKKGARRGARHPEPASEVEGETIHRHVPAHVGTVACMWAIHTQVIPLSYGVSSLVGSEVVKFPSHGFECKGEEK